MSALLADFKVCLVTFPTAAIGGGHVLVENFLRVLEPLTREIYLITGNYPDSAIFSPKIHLRNISHDSKRQPILIRIPKYIVTQLRISYNLARVVKKTDVVIFFLGGPLLLPMLTAKLLGKRTLLIVTGSGGESAKQQYRESSLSKAILPFALAVLEKLNYKIAGRIIVYSPSLAQEFGLERYKHKSSIAHEHFLDFDRFKIQKPLNERDNLVGYIGRLSQEKGILNLMEAIPKVAKTTDEAAFLIGGDGQLRPQVEKYTNKLNNKVKFVGRIPHDEFPAHLNKLKLLVLPSYTEGLPHIMLEAMACGTPVLATPVGAIPDIIKDGETGFIMENNSPECIAENIVRAINHPNLEQIARNARALVEREFTYQAALERYRDILASLNLKQ